MDLKELKAKVAELIKTIKIEDVATFAQTTYNVTINTRYIKGIKTQAIKAENGLMFFCALQKHIRNAKFPDTTSEVTNIDIERILNPKYPETLVEDFCNYFNINK